MALQVGLCFARLKTQKKCFVMKGLKCAADIASYIHCVKNYRIVSVHVLTQSVSINKYNFCLKVIDETHKGNSFMN